MDSQMNFVSGVFVGAGLMYLLDPNRGRRRRALVRDQIVHGAHEIEDLGERAERQGRHVRNRARGVAADVRVARGDGIVDDTVLESRVRSDIGRVVSNPGAIRMRAEHGRVTLSGPVRADEVDRLLSTTGSVRGVTSVESRLETHASAGEVPGLQGTED